MRSIGDIPIDRPKSQGTIQPRGNGVRRKRPRINIVDENDNFRRPGGTFSTQDNDLKFDRIPQNNRKSSIPQSNQESFAKNPNFENPTKVSNKKSSEDLYSQEANSKPLEADPDNL